MSVTFEQARQKVSEAWPDYRIAPYGYESETEFFLLLLPERAGGRIPAVLKSSGRIRWINENADEYTQESPVGAWPLRTRP